MIMTITMMYNLMSESADFYYSTQLMF